MRHSAQVAQRLFFLDSVRHRLLASVSTPADLQAGHGIVVCPAFADEMNRTRRTIHLLMNEAAQAGIATINVDLHGTGDSTGEFADCSWDGWLADLGQAAGWLRGQGCSQVTLLGVRAGALLAWALALAPATPVRSIVLWQPVLTGRTVITDLLRARALAGAAGEGRESVAVLREQLRGGRPVEAAGYALSPEMARALDEARISAAAGATCPPVAWFEIIDGPQGAPRPAAERTAAELASAGVDVDLRAVADPPFWATAEVTTGCGAVEATVRWLAERP